MRPTVDFDNVAIDRRLYEFVGREAIPGTGIVERDFWLGFAALVRRLAPRNAALMRHRDHLQTQIDAWHRRNPGAGFDITAYREHLRVIGYLEPDAAEFHIGTENVDPEIALIAGPQLVVPVDNARYALNAANARWGSLYDALYGTDAIGDGAGHGGAYSAVHGARVIEFVREFLDRYFTLNEGSHRDTVGYRVGAQGLEAQLRNGRTVRLRDRTAFAGYQGAPFDPSALLLVHHGLHVEIQFDRTHFIGAVDAAGISDVVLESAVSTIQDFEDSVAAVDVDDKLLVYRNWLQLMQGTLRADVAKDGRQFVRGLQADRAYRSPAGVEIVLPGRSLLLARNVGHHLLSDAVTLDGGPVPETIIDCAVTALAALHDLRAHGNTRNSRRGSIYIVKPKMHGSAEVALAEHLFSGIEDLLAVPRDTLKMGIMDEERRTSVNLAACIHAARNRVVFINTGFLDRTGDEIHTSMEAAPVARKGDLKHTRWLDAYERRNVDVGLACGLRGRAQIGKGMWAMPDLMADMLRQKIAQPQAGANTAWVPSPTAATLHALHYHAVDVARVQSDLAGRPLESLADILTPPLAALPAWSEAEIDEELQNNAQSILGYVVRWIDFGIGCSKVPDFHDVALMEDRATLRISSQHGANWLLHGICTRERLMHAMRRMASVVDRQNSDDPRYAPMGADLEHNTAFRAACDLVLTGREQANGYTETILHARRRQRKAACS